MMFVIYSIMMFIIYRGDGLASGRREMHTNMADTGGDSPIVWTFGLRQAPPISFIVWP